MEKMSVDDFVATNVLKEFQPVMEKIREVMKAFAPNAQEIISYGIPSYRVRNIIAVIGPS